MSDEHDLQTSLDLGGAHAATADGSSGPRQGPPTPRAQASEGPPHRSEPKPSTAEPRLQEWFTAEEAAVYTRLSVKALYQRRERGQVRGYTMGHGRALRFRRRDLDALMTPDRRP